MMSASTSVVYPSMTLKDEVIKFIIKNLHKYDWKGRGVFETLPKTLAEEFLGKLVKTGYVDNSLLNQCISGQTKKLDFRPVTEPYFDEWTPKIIQKCGGLQELRLANVAVPQRLLIKMFSKLSRVRILQFVSSTSLNNHVMKAISKSCPCLQELVIRWTSVGDDGLVALAENSHCLVAVDFTGLKITDIGFSAFVTGKSRKLLREIKVNRCDWLTSSSIIQGFESCDALKDYDFIGQGVDSGVVADYLTGKIAGPKLRNISFTVGF